jgi:hypothetical protein
MVENEASSIATKLGITTEHFEDSPETNFLV